MQNRSMSFWEATKLFWTRAFDFSGRSRRKEFWVQVFTQVLFYIISVVIYLFIMISGLFAIDTSSTDGNHEAFAFTTISIAVMIVFLCLISLILLIPNIFLLVRRLHDIGKSGKWAIL
ncbi:DUF805 domain-containing protein [Macrococcus sp. PK]|uniref:DUF805 domain-containing protein n=1 Tax=Macrococcus sp. PK TaxID=2801919 RepID=UPI001F0D40C2|nr:DUF805 domain-containing protein [Macrococcus sp. PK]MCH4985149.1 DUF805 domain-containing protein [Macrococcus sp. PK]